MRLNRLNISMRSCVVILSPMGVFLKTEKSTSAIPGPVIGVAHRRAPGSCRRINKRSGIQPVQPNPSLAKTRVRIDSRHRICALVAVIGAGCVTGTIHREGQAAMEGHQAVQLPAFGQRSPVLRSGKLIRDQPHKDVAVVKIARTVVALEVEAVLRKSSAVSSNFIKAVRPGVGGLRRETVETGSPDRCLQRSCSSRFRCFRSD